MKTIRVLLLVALSCLALPPSVSAFYNPSTGRWLNRDPVEEQGGANLYGAMANDPIRKADPAGLILDWFRKKENKPCCCCCAEDILFQNIEPYQKGTLFGHSFKTMIKLRYVLSGSRGDCKLEWWERSQSNTRRPEDSYNWTEMWGGGSGPRASSFKGWIETPRPCPGSVVLPDDDEPKISTLVIARRELDFIIMAFSTPGCPCQFRKVSITAKQILKVGENREILLQEFEPGQTQYN